MRSPGQSYEIKDYRRAMVLEVRNYGQVRLLGKEHFKSGLGLETEEGKTQHRCDNSTREPEGDNQKMRLEGTVTAGPESTQTLLGPLTVSAPRRQQAGVGRRPGRPCEPETRARGSQSLRSLESTIERNQSKALSLTDST